MKSLRILLTVVATALVALACNNLDLEPKGILDEGTLLNSENGVQKYLANLYNELPIEDFNYKAIATDGSEKGYGTANSYGHHIGNIWEAQKGSPAVAAMEATGRGAADGNPDAWGYWPYDRIRDINIFINSFPDYADNFSGNRYNEILGEAHFIRAYYYFGLVKRYGGVPIITDVLDPTDDIETLQLPRNTEYECWNFIHDDLEFAMENMSFDKSSLGRANRYAAAALMAKTMLYAGSVAKYNFYTGVVGEATLEGLMGMDPSMAAEFFKYAYDACKVIVEAGYTLHTGADKVKAYKEVFLEETAEDIFVKYYGPKSTTGYFSALYHCWDTEVLPLGTNLAQAVGCNLHPTAELVSLFDMPAITDENGYPVRFNRIEDLWDNDEMEARCKADFFFSGMVEPVSGHVFDTQGGIFKSCPGTALDCVPDWNLDSPYTIAYRVRGAQPNTHMDIPPYGDVKINGENGPATTVGDESYTQTGMYVQKYVNYKADPTTRILFGSIQPFKVFRYGEILCNLAEAAYELGLEKEDENLLDEAFGYIAQLRDRAGARPRARVHNPEDVGEALYGYPLDENLLFIRQERARELCFENQANWDQRRWRISHRIYNNTYPHGIVGYKVLDEDKYIFLKDGIRFVRTLTYNQRAYYEQIPGAEITRNPNMVRNDGY